VKHTLAVLVENKPGVLARISNMFARRGFNIDSLAVGPTERHDRSRITLVVEACSIAKVFYPVFPPDKNVEDVIAWLEART